MSEEPPLIYLYFEESRFQCGRHYQSIIREVPGNIIDTILERERDQVQPNLNIGDGLDLAQVENCDDLFICTGVLCDHEFPLISSMLSGLLLEIRH